jgi:hypothetical protein
VLLNALSDACTALFVAEFTFFAEFFRVAVAEGILLIRNTKFESPNYVKVNKTK